MFYHHHQTTIRSQQHLLISEGIIIQIVTGIEVITKSHSHGSVSVVRTTLKVYGKMQTLTLSQPKTPEPIVTKF